MRKLILTAGAIFSVIGLMAQEDCSELFFSEYLEGTGNNKGLEVYNPTDEVINLNAYYVARYSNGSNTYTDGGITQLQGFIQPYKTHFIVNGQTTSTEISPASDPNLRALAQQLDHDYPAPTYMNGNDAIALFKDTGGSGDVNDFVLVDLFGIIGGGMPPDGEGWASITDQWIYRNVYEAGEVVGQDSFYVTNYIIPDGYYFLKWWLWSANHALVRKPGVKKGVTAATMPTVEFNVTMEWDTVPGGADVWDSLNAHYCNCEFPTAIENKNVIESISIYPNPFTSSVKVFADEPIQSVAIFDLTGKRVFSRKLKGIRREAFNIEHLSEGIYLVQVQTTGTLYSRRIIKR
ncbi:MAG: T9SS type A sorting domain-containing protein [Bacteroidales bacterium]|nr:T9SS type A sorting domain-containing protein [Bacteroidales bacterium]